MSEVNFDAKHSDSCLVFFKWKTQYAENKSAFSSSMKAKKGSRNPHSAFHDYGK